MSRRVLSFGAILGVLAAALLVILSILDVITVPEMKETLGKTVMVIGVSTLAIVLMSVIGRLGKEPGGDDSGRRDDSGSR